MRAVELLSVCVFSVLVFSNAAMLVVSPWLLPLAGLIGWLLADLLSGLAHWAGDRFGSERTPVLGPALIRPFREHHSDPRAMTRHDFIEVNGASCLGCVPVLLICLYLDGFLQAMVLCTSVGVLLANQCHKWAHTQRPPGFVTNLQKIGLILRAEEHRLHHRSPYNSHYCTASGWLNRPLNLLLK